MKKALLSGIILSALLFMIIPNTSGQDTGQDKIRLGTFEGIPANIAPANFHSDEYAIISFDKLPDDQMRSSLTNKGIMLGDYIQGKSYYCKLTSPAKITNEDKVFHSISKITKAMKISPLAQSRLKSINKKKGSFYVRFHRGTDKEKMLSILSQRGVTVRNTNSEPFNSANIEASPEELNSLLSHNDVKRVDFSLAESVDLNEKTARLTGARTVYNRKSYSKPTGQNVNVALWESGVAYNHTDLSGRLTVVDSDATRSAHATHCTGTILGAGTLDPQAKGMAPKAKAFVYDTRGSRWDEMRDSIALHDVAVSSHSWAYESGWYHLRTGDRNWVWWDTEIFGLYHEYTADADTLVYEYDFPIVKGVGNDRNDSYMGPHEHEDTGSGVLHEDLHDPNPDFDTITPVSCAKNIISVGAVTKDLEMTDFSSWGPTDDGRVKPDVVAVGLGVYSLAPEDGYVTMGGTSMSTPNTAGVATLIIDAYKKLGGKRMGSALLKAFLIHGTRDLGPEGPDFMYGHGFVDTEMSLRVMNSAAYDEQFAGLKFKKNRKPNPYSVRARVVENSIKHKEKLQYSFTIPQGAKEVRATLVWNDPAGAKLVNNINMVMKKKGEKTIKPWALKASSPTAPAKRKSNNVDNVETIRLASPAAGEWTVLLTGKKITSKSQKFVLIVSAGDSNQPIELKTEGTISLSQFSIWRASMANNTITLHNQQNSFSRGDGFIFQLNGSVFENAKYENYYGAVQLYISMKNSDGKLVLKYQRTEDQYDGDFSQYSELYFVPRDLPPGEYILEATATLHNDQKAILSRTITIQD